MYYMFIYIYRYAVGLAFSRQSQRMMRPSGS